VADAGRPALDEREERMRATFALTGVAGAGGWRIPAGLISGDARLAALYNLSVDEAAEGFSPHLFFSIIHPQDQTRIRLAVGGMLRGAEVFSKEYRLGGGGRGSWLAPGRRPS